MCLTMFTTGCAGPCPEVRPAMPPAVYLQDVEIPRLRGRTNADLAAWSVELAAALKLSNSDKDGLRQWVQDMQGSGKGDHD